MESYGSYPPALAKNFIAQEEGRRLKAYQCSAGVQEGDEITAAEADSLLIDDIAATQKEFAHYVNVPVSEGQFIALTSLAFNLGAANVPRKCPRLMQALNAGEYEAAAKEFLDVTGGGPGLVARRRREYALFMGEST